MYKVPNCYCPIHATGVKLTDDFTVTPLQYVGLRSALCMDEPAGILRPALLHRFTHSSRSGGQAPQERAELHPICDAARTMAPEVTR